MQGQNMNEQEVKVRNRSRFSLIVLLAIFLLPVILAYVVHKNPGLRPASTKNNGILYQPAVVLRDLALQTNDDKAFTLERMRVTWGLIYVGNEQCDGPCQDTLIKARNSIIAQGGEGTRIHYYYISATMDHRVQQQLEKVHPRMIFLHATRARLADMLAQFRIEKNHQPGNDNRLYLVDPAGNLLMHYPAGFKDLGLMEDLKHLLKWSHIG